MMRKTQLLFIFLVLVNVGWCGKIVYPWRATTAIVKSGESFELWFSADSGQIVNSVLLSGPYNTVKTTLLIKKGNWVYDVTSLNTYNTKIQVNIPISTPADRYDIILNTSTGKVISLAAVKVIKKYKSDYYILHFSDVHAFQKGSETVLQRISTIIDIANIINPEIVFNTGDNLYRPTEDRMNQVFVGNDKLETKGLNKLNAATFTVAGNHDTDFDNVPAKGFYKEKSDWWNNWWGLQAYNFKYGNGRFMIINDGWEGFNPAQQIEDATSWLHASGIGNLRVGVAHIKNQEMNALDSAVNLGLVLIGHNHHIANQNPAPLNNKPIQYIVNSVREHVEFNLYKVNSKTGNYTAVGGPTAQVEYIENPNDIKNPALYKPKLTLSFFKANDGSSTDNTATIVNKFNFPVQDARVRFIMPLGKKYFVTKAKIEQSFKGTSVQVIDVNVDLEPMSTTVVEIGSSIKQ